MPAMRSASREMGGLDAPASSTMRRMRLKDVSAPTASTRMRKNESVFTVAVVTLSPTPRNTGMLSPVSMLSSMDAPPSITVPSAGTRAPGFT